MANEINDLKRILLLVLIAIPAIATVNINCNGKAFHCVNSTHFMICVDLGGGLSTTIDDFVIPCPETTVCQAHNIFECEFPKIEETLPPLHVLGVEKQSDISETTLVTNSDDVTKPAATSDIVSVFNDTVPNTTARPEEKLVLNANVLRSNNKNTGVNKDNTTILNSHVTSNIIDSAKEMNDKQSNNSNVMTISATDKNKNHEIDVKNATNTSASDNSKSTDINTSAVECINSKPIIDLHSVKIEAPTDVSTSSNTFNYTNSKANKLNEPLQIVPTHTSIFTSEVNSSSANPSRDIVANMEDNIGVVVTEVRPAFVDDILNKKSITAYRTTNNLTNTVHVTPIETDYSSSEFKNVDSKIQATTENTFAYIKKVYSNITESGYVASTFQNKLNENITLIDMPNTVPNKPLIQEVKIVNLTLNKYDFVQDSVILPPRNINNSTNSIDNHSFFLRVRDLPKNITTSPTVKSNSFSSFIDNSDPLFSTKPETKQVESSSNKNKLIVEETYKDERYNTSNQIPETITEHLIPVSLDLITEPVAVGANTQTNNTAIPLIDQFNTTLIPNTTVTTLPIDFTAKIDQNLNQNNDKFGVIEQPVTPKAVFSDVITISAVDTSSNTSNKIISENYMDDVDQTNNILESATADQSAKSTTENTFVLLAEELDHTIIQNVANVTPRIDVLTDEDTINLHIQGYSNIETEAVTSERHILTNKSVSIVPVAINSTQVKQNFTVPNNSTKKENSFDNNLTLKSASVNLNNLPNIGSGILTDKSEVNPNIVQDALITKPSLIETNAPKNNFQVPTKTFVTQEAIQETVNNDTEIPIVPVEISTNGEVDTFIEVNNNTEKKSTGKSDTVNIFGLGTIVEYSDPVKIDMISKSITVQPDLLTTTEENSPSGIITATSLQDPLILISPTNVSTDEVGNIFTPMAKPATTYNKNVDSVSNIMTIEGVSYTDSSQGHIANPGPSLNEKVNSLPEKSTLTTNNIATIASTQPFADVTTSMNNDNAVSTTPQVPVPLTMHNNVVDNDKGKSSVKPSNSIVATKKIAITASKVPSADVAIDKTYDNVVPMADEIPKPSTLGSNVVDIHKNKSSVQTVLVPENTNEHLTSIEKSPTNVLIIVGVSSSEPSTKDLNTKLGTLYIEKENSFPEKSTVPTVATEKIAITASTVPSSDVVVDKTFENVPKTDQIPKLSTLDNNVVDIHKNKSSVEIFVVPENTNEHLTSTEISPTNVLTTIAVSNTDSSTKLGTSYDERVNSITEKSIFVIDNIGITEPTADVAITTANNNVVPKINQVPILWEDHGSKVDNNIDKPSVPIYLVPENRTERLTSTQVSPTDILTTVDFSNTDSTATDQMTKLGTSYKEETTNIPQKSILVTENIGITVSTEPSVDAAIAMPKDNVVQMMDQAPKLSTVDNKKDKSLVQIELVPKSSTDPLDSSQISHTSILTTAGVAHTDSLQDEFRNLETSYNEKVISIPEKITLVTENIGVTTSTESFPNIAIAVTNDKDVPTMEQAPLLLTNYSNIVNHDTLVLIGNTSIKTLASIDGVNTSTVINRHIKTNKTDNAFQNGFTDINVAVNNIQNNSVAQNNNPSLISTIKLTELSQSTSHSNRVKGSPDKVATTIALEAKPSNIKTIDNTTKNIVTAMNNLKSKISENTHTTTNDQINSSGCNLSTYPKNNNNIQHQFTGQTLAEKNIIKESSDQIKESENNKDRISPSVTDVIQEFETVKINLNSSFGTSVPLSIVDENSSNSQTQKISESLSDVNNLHFLLNNKPVSVIKQISDKKATIVYNPQSVSITASPANIPDNTDKVSLPNMKDLTNYTNLATPVEAHNSVITSKDISSSDGQNINVETHKTDLMQDTKNSLKLKQLKIYSNIPGTVVNANYNNYFIGNSSTVNNHTTVTQNISNEVLHKVAGNTVGPISTEMIKIQAPEIIIVEKISQSNSSSSVFNNLEATTTDKTFNESMITKIPASTTTAKHNIQSAIDLQENNAVVRKPLQITDTSLLIGLVPSTSYNTISSQSDHKIENAGLVSHKLRVTQDTNIAVKNPIGDIKATEVKYKNISSGSNSSVSILDNTRTPLPREISTTIVQDLTSINSGIKNGSVTAVPSGSVLETNSIHTTKHDYIDSEKKVASNNKSTLSLKQLHNLDSDNLKSISNADTWTSNGQEVNSQIPVQSNSANVANIAIFTSTDNKSNLKSHQIENIFSNISVHPQTTITKSISCNYNLGITNSPNVINKKNSTNVVKVTNSSSTTIPQIVNIQKESTPDYTINTKFQNLDTSKLLNELNKVTVTEESSIEEKLTEHLLQNKMATINSDQKLYSVEQNSDQKIQTVNPTVSKVNPNKDEIIEIVSTKNTVNSLNTIPNATLQLSRSYPTLSNSYKDTMQSQNRSGSITTNDYDVKKTLITDYIKSISKTLGVVPTEKTKLPQMLSTSGLNNERIQIVYPTVSTVNPNKDEIIEIVSTKNTLNSLNTIPNATLQLSSSYPTLSNSYKDSMQTQNRSVSVTTTDYDVKKTLITDYIKTISKTLGVVPTERTKLSTPKILSTSGLDNENNRDVSFTTTLLSNSFDRVYPNVNYEIRPQGIVKISSVNNMPTIVRDSIKSSFPTQAAFSSTGITPIQKIVITSNTGLSQSPLLVKLIKSIYSPQDEVSNVYKNPLVVSDTNIESIIKTPKSDSLVETIIFSKEKVKEPYVVSKITKDFQRSYDNSNVTLMQKVADNEKHAIGSNPNATEQVTNSSSIKIFNIHRGDTVKYSENDGKGSIDKAEIVNIEKNETTENKGILMAKDTTVRSDVDFKNKYFPYAAVMSQANIDNNPIDYKYKLRLGIVTNYSTGANESVASKGNSETEANVYVNENTHNSSYVNITPDFEKARVRPNLENKTDNIGVSIVKRNSTINDNLVDLTSTNHTVTAYVQSCLNKVGKQGNKTSDEPRLDESSMHKANTANVQINASSKVISTSTESPPVFNCIARGRYADKKDCRKFYTCIGNLQPIMGTCPNNTVFSEINKQCTRNLSHCVRNNQFRCLLEGRFSDFFKDNVYYICVKNDTNHFTRYKLRCQDGYHLDKESVRCERDEMTSTQSASSVSEISNDETTTPKTKSEKIKNSSGSDDFECEKEGNFPYAKDCRKYYVCTKVKDVYRRKIKKCSKDEVYDKKKKKCVDSDSREC